MSSIVKGIVDKHDNNPANLIPILQDVQSEDGYLSGEALADIAQLLGISESTIYGVATFYTQFKFIKPGEHQIKLCQGTACHVKGSNTLLDVMKTTLKIEPGETTADGKVSLERVACLGCCALAPVIVVDDEVHGKMTQDSTSKLLKNFEEAGDE
jgi:NADH-quinone oxidoreductase subunit E